MASPSAAETSQRRRGRIAVATAIIATCVFVALLVGGALAWHFSDALLVPNHDGWQRVEVASAGPRSVTLERDDATERPGVYGLLWRGGHAIVGPVLAKGPETVTRALSDPDAYLAPEKEAWLDTDVYTGDPREALDLPYRTVEVHGELGPMPAWVIPPARGGGAHGPRGAGETWALVVHGLNGDLQEGLRAVPALRRAGLTSMLITYREDPGAPESPDGLHHLGMTEWRDLAASARYALAHGARHLVLYGYSMGGAIATQFMERSPLASRVSAMVLDAPALDWRRVLEFNAERTGFPASAANPLEWAIAARIDVDWERLDALRHTGDLRVPTLLFQGAEDELVPPSLSRAYAAALPGFVTLRMFPRAGHTQSWNVDPPRYERQLSEFLAMPSFR